MQNKVENWVDNLTQNEQEECYNQIVDYFTERVYQEVLEKYNNSLDFNSQKV